MVVADLHVHTTNSDGTMTLDDIPAAARRAGVEVIAVTDHDRLHPDLPEPVTTLDGVTVVHGIELRVETSQERIDLLGYGVRRTAELTAELDRLQEDRIERARRIVSCVEDRLGVDLEVAFEPGVGRPHIARAIADSPAGYDYEGAFDHLIGGGRPCFVARDVPSFERGRELLAGACAVVGLAHPLRSADPEHALERADALDAVELPYPYGREVDLTPVERAIEEYDLLVTGGSDAHDERLGIAGLDREQYRRFSERLDV
jgi:predicted metal-dependent phosphoesterase TrpH